jgi:hypothetical protein
MILIKAQKAHQDLVQKVLDELLLQRPRSQETVQVGSQKLRDEVTDSTNERRVVSDVFTCGWR